MPIFLHENREQQRTRTHTNLNMLENVLNTGCIEFRGGVKMSHI
jgi:hypothetical protein